MFSLMSFVRVSGLYPNVTAPIIRAAVAGANHCHWKSRRGANHPAGSVAGLDPKTRSLTFGDGFRGAQAAKVASRGFELFVIIFSQAGT